MMWMELLFLAVFTIQILLLSYYYPSRVANRMAYIFKHYPIETHGKLYPEGFEKALRGKILFSLINGIIVILGMIILIAVTIFIFEEDTELRKFSFLPLAFGMIQAIPLLLLELSGIKQFKKMRADNKDPKRSAALNPRSLFNFVSPARLAFTLVTCLLCIFVVLKLNDFKLGETEGTLIFSLFLSNALFIGIGYYLIYGKKLDPHQAPQDRHMATKAVIHSYTSVSILISIFFIILRSVNVYSLDNWEPMINSLYWLAVMFVSTGAVLKQVNVKTVDFDVYKTSARTQTEQ